MDELENPFRPGAGTPPPALVGGDPLIEQFRITVGRAVRGRPGKSVMPIGLRGVGKTVLLNRFNEVAENEGLLTGYIEAPDDGRFVRLLITRLRSILLRLERGDKASRAVRRALGALRSFTLGLPDGSSISIAADTLVGVADSGELSEDLTDVLVAAGEAAADRGTGIVLAIDEVQYLSARELAVLIGAIHRTVQLDLPVVLVGAGLPSFRRSRATRSRTPSACSPFLRLDRWSRTRHVTCWSFRCETRESDSAARCSICAQSTKGYPYFLQEWGYEVWNVADGSPIEVDDVARATPIVRQRLDDASSLLSTDSLRRRRRTSARWPTWVQARMGRGHRRPARRRG